ncbi:hypothetical protein EVAR_81596_1 [Eumeta japonica]|uniref:Uncharacterized protein n=1 Tax=Eumeta variegata TaxID=151549 RepID=A0A4C1WCB1_EUMVA|nr:hypothetical protein EVAR_81596_1 [Eumeta japonica]
MHIERLGISFCCITGPRSVSISPGLAVLLNGSTFKTSMKYRVQCTIPGRNREEQTPFSQACSLLSALKDGVSREAITPRTVSVDAISVSFEAEKVTNRLRRIKSVPGSIPNRARYFQVLQQCIAKDKAAKPQQRIRAFLGALKRSAESVPGAKIFLGAITPRTSGVKRKKVPTNPTTASTRAQKWKFDPPAPVPIRQLRLFIHKKSK